MSADDWQGRALAAEAAADGYRQRAERAEAQVRAVEEVADEYAKMARAAGTTSPFAADIRAALTVARVGTGWQRGFDADAVQP